MEIAKLRLVCLQGAKFTERDFDDYSGAYQLWKNVWSKTFAELEGARHLNSDDFTRQDEILALFSDETCVALVCQRYFDPRNPAIWDDSYFRPWTPEARRALCRGPRLVIGNQITIHSNYRGRSGGVSLKDLILSCFLVYHDRRGVDAITGTMRADKGMHGLAYDCGAQALERGVIFHNVPVDIVAFFPKTSPIRVPAELELLTLRLLKGLETFAEGKSTEARRAA